MSLRSVSFALVLCGCAATLPAADPELDGQKLNVSQLAPEHITGLLGHPMGTVVVVEGVAAEGPRQQDAPEKSVILLKVDTVDRKKLPRQVVFRFGPRVDKKVEPPKPGERFAYLANESGAFEGQVNAHYGDNELEAAKFHFESQLVIHAARYINGIPLLLGDSEQTMRDKMVELKARDATSETKFMLGREIANPQSHFWWELADKTIVGVELAGRTKEDQSIIGIYLSTPRVGVARMTRNTSLRSVQAFAGKRETVYDPNTIPLVLDPKFGESKSP